MVAKGSGDHCKYEIIFWYFNDRYIYDDRYIHDNDLNYKGVLMMVLVVDLDYNDYGKEVYAMVLWIIVTAFLRMKATLSDNKFWKVNSSKVSLVIILVMKIIANISMV